mgnify:CR=1 FL=1
MAVNTSKTYRNMVMYSVFVRNFSEEGTFRQVQNELERIKALGVDIIWLMPIHPIGEKARKGTLGSPYAIRDYRAIDPALGTMDDFKALVDAIHALGMRCIIDVVYNHTSPDSWMAEHHPEWFYHKPDGSFGNRIGDWTDVIDLDYSNPGLWDYQIETLKMWAGIVDGFRCDVAPLIPLEFWLRARREVEAVRPGCLWLSESTEPEFVAWNRARGVPCLSDSEIFQAFDVSYEYDIFTYYKDYLTGKIPLSEYAAAINRQESIYPENFVKLRFLENHDRARAKLMTGDERSLRNWTAFLYFQKGMTLLYAGQEREDAHRPSLFEKDIVNWTGKDISPLLRRLYEIKKDPLFTDSGYEVKAMPRDVLLAEHSRGGRRMLGIFSLRGESALVNVCAPDGIYRNEIDGAIVEIYEGMLRTDGEPIIAEIG